jgi:hypothetical protein
MVANDQCSMPGHADVPVTVSSKTNCRYIDSTEIEVEELYRYGVCSTLRAMSN